MRDTSRWRGSKKETERVKRKFRRIRWLKGRSLGFFCGESKVNYEFIVKRMKWKIGELIEWLS